MKYVNNKVVTEIIINKSRFITHLIPVKNVDEAADILKDVKKQHYSATHNCYAYIIDKQMLQKMSDDGEPSRTAGLPILETLLQNNLDNVICIVTRYFGGVKLGKGGLIRAYKNATSEAIKKASFYKKETKQIYKAVIPYNLYESFNYITKEKAFILDEQFLETITIKFYLNDNNIESLNDQFHGQIDFEQLKKIKVKVPL